MGTKIVLAGNLPEGFSGTPQEVLEQFASLLRVVDDQSAVGGVTRGPTEPASQSDIWIDDSDPKRTRIKVYNTGYARWLPAYDIPIGAIVMSAPSGVNVGQIDGRPDWLICDGATYQAADYPELYDFLTNLTASTDPTWGPLLAAGGATSFCVPDLRGRVPLGVGTGVDYASKKANTNERVMGSKGTTIEGDDGSAPQTNHPGYPGHEFIRPESRPSPGATTRPIQQMVKYPEALVQPQSVPSYGSAIAAVMPPATVLQFLIKAR